jgi:hypothetical protein
MQQIKHARILIERAVSEALTHIERAQLLSYSAQILSLNAKILTKLATSESPPHTVHCEARS